MTFFAAAAIGLCFLMTQRAQAVWDVLPQLHYVAFPWRLLAPAACCIALLAAAIGLAIPRLPERWRGAAVAACAAAIVLTALPHAQPAGYLSLDPELWTPRQIAARGVLPATFDTFEPRWVAERPSYRGEQLQVTRGAASAAITERTPARLVASVRAATEAGLELPVAFFPGWHLRLDGVEQPANDVTPTGRMRVTVAAGAHRIEASFERTPVRWLADLLSAAALLMTSALLRRTR
jgi:hypothetical protein